MCDLETGTHASCLLTYFRDSMPITIFWVGEFGFAFDDEGGVVSEFVRSLLATWRYINILRRQ